jgi:hypothetical protein
MVNKGKSKLFFRKRTFLMSLHKAAKRLYESVNGNAEGKNKSPIRYNLCLLTLTCLLLPGEPLFKNRP